MAGERRRKRSRDARSALVYQLDHVREEGCLDALVLADEDGLVVAEAGDRGLCASLAAVAPLVGRGAFPIHQEMPASYVHVRKLEHEGSALYLASCSDSFADTLSARLDVWLEHTHRGVKRILAA